MPLVIAGVGRLAAVRATSYQEVHSEYGVHWNFFFTLALVAYATQRLAPRSAGGRAAAASAVLDPPAVLSGGLSGWVQHAPRDNLLSATKEGRLFARILALALAGTAAGAAAKHARATRRCRHGLRRLGALALADGALRAAAHAADEHVERTSRQLCNAAYVLWVLAQVGLVLLLAMLRSAVHLGGGESASDDGGDDGGGLPILAAINRHPLRVFLAANLLTGAANLSMDTHHASDASALAVLGVYMSAVCALAVGLRAGERARARGQIRGGILPRQALSPIHLRRRRGFQPPRIRTGDARLARDAAH